MSCCKALILCRTTFLCFVFHTLYPVPFPVSYSIYPIPFPIHPVHTISHLVYPIPCLPRSLPHLSPSKLLCFPTSVWSSVQSLDSIKRPRLCAELHKASFYPFIKFNAPVRNRSALMILCYMINNFVSEWFLSLRASQSDPVTSLCADVHHCSIL